MYVCGQTVYDYCHIGHARSMIVFDMIVRYFRYQKYKVTYVRNITDIDDKIIKRAQENNESSEALTKRFIDIMHADENALHLLKPDYEPRATEFIAPIIKLIEQLIEKSFAYIAKNGEVCFEVRKFKEYGKLSKRDIEKLIAGSRIDINEGKKDPLDFVLWKLAKPNEPQWNSPWGRGRPGWHIECSAMAEGILGQTFDIHGGGMDLKFPHHENEIAQSEAAHDCTFANVWMHAGLLTINNEKMSKSLNNFFTIKEVLDQYPAETVRYLMLSAHYRSPVNYSTESMEQASQSLKRLYTAIRGLNCESTSEENNLYAQKFHEAMQDDFNSPIAFSILFDMAREINRHRENNDIENAEKLASQLKKWGQVFGILQMDPGLFLQGKIDESFAEKIESLITARNIARQNKNFKEADNIRSQLQDMNVVIEDSANGTIWKKV